MKKLKFVIAVSSETFAVTVQEKLEDKAGSDSEIIIITDSNYLEKFFNLPQRIDVLLIDEKFYSRTIEKHDIDLICILSEKIENCDKVNTGFIYTVYKNSGIDKIIQIMLSAINPAMLEKNTSQERCKMVLVTSPLGGSGKTVTAAAIAYYLHKSGMKVLFADTTSFQSSEHWIANEKKSIDDDYILNNFNVDGLGDIIVHGNIDHIAFFSQALPALDINAGSYYEVINAEKNKGNYDYIVVDSESCFSTDLINFMTIADYVIILALQDEVSVSKMRRFLRSFECSDKSKYIVCCSKFCIEKKNYLREKLDFLHISAYIPMVNLNGAHISDISKIQCFNRIASMLFL